MLTVLTPIFIELYQTLSPRKRLGKGSGSARLIDLRQQPVRAYQFGTGYGRARLLIEEVSVTTTCTHTDRPTHTMAIELAQPEPLPDCTRVSVW